MRIAFTLASLLAPIFLQPLPLSVAAQTNAAQPGYPFISCDVDTYEITKFNASGEPVWTYSQVRPIDAWPMPDGSVLVSYLPSARTANKGGVRLIAGDKRTVFDHPYNDEIMSCQPMTNGNILINECGAGRITEIDRSGKIIRSFDVQAKGKGHQTARFIRLTPNNTVLVAECYSHKLREYDFTGKVLSEWNLQMAYSGTRLANGNTLISGYKPAQLVEVDPTGKTVWTLSAMDLSTDLNIGSFCESTRLSNGNTLIACASRSSKPGPRVVLLEVSPDKRVVWKQMEPSRARETTSLKPVPY
jgi:outer membrane protein assembly factor BamB